MITKDYVRQLRNRLVHARTIDEQQEAADELRRVTREVLSWPLRAESQLQVEGLEAAVTASPQHAPTASDLDYLAEVVIRRNKEALASGQPPPFTRMIQPKNLRPDSPPIIRPLSELDFLPQRILSGLGVLEAGVTPSAGLDPNLPDPLTIPIPPKEDQEAYAAWVTAVHVYAHRHIQRALKKGDYASVEQLADRYLALLPDDIHMLGLYSQAMLHLVLTEHIDTQEGEQRRTKALCNFQALHEMEQSPSVEEEYTDFPPEIGEALRRENYSRALNLATELFTSRDTAVNRREIVYMYGRVIDICRDHNVIPQDIYNKVRGLIAEELALPDGPRID
jgi:hypothetical protein